VTQATKPRRRHGEGGQRTCGKAQAAQRGCWQNPKEFRPASTGEPAMNREIAGLRTE